MLFSMQYHEILIFANHPYVADNSHNQDLQQMRRVCKMSASAIAQLLLLYERQWSLARINIQAVKIVFSAALVHLYDVCEDEPNSNNVLQSLADLKVCCHALCLFSRCFNNGT